MNALMRIPFASRAYGVVARIFASSVCATRWVGNRTRNAWQTLRATPWAVLRARLLLAITVTGISVFWGIATSVLQWSAVYLIIGLILSLFILIDFRVGVVTLILFLPISSSTIFPHQLLGITGLNPLNILLIATLLSYGVRRFFGATRYRFLPREIGWLYILPIICAAAIGAFHFGDIPGFVVHELDLDIGGAPGYIRDFFVRPMYLVVFALLLAAAVIETRRVEGFLIAGLVSLWVVVLTVIIFFLASGSSLSDISGEGGASRSFFSPLGLHSNSVGRFFAIACGILIFSASSYKTFLSRIVVWSSAGITVLAILITFSRGAYLVLMIIVALYLKSLKSKNRFLILAMVLPALLFVLPGAVYDRIFFGVGTGADLNAVSSGRTEEIWQPLFPEIFNSPVLGHGLSSILWSDAMKSGSILVVGHPHNAFLKSLLDMGFLGTTLVFIFGWRVWKRMQHFSREPLLEPQLRNFFAGASAALVGFTLAGISGSSFDPVVDQVFLWFAIGLMYGLGMKLELAKRVHG